VHERVRVFIGSGEASLLERKTLIYSIRKYTRRDLDINVFNGTHNAVEPNDGEAYLAPLPLKLKYRNFTEFSLYRYLIPELCNYEGKAIWLDSDMVCLADIGELFDAPLDDHDFLAKKEAYAGSGLWGLSVMLIDCAKCRFELEAIMEGVDRGLYSYTDFSEMSPAFLRHHPYDIGELDPNWNVFDRVDERTKLIHYTNLFTQPWKAPNHPAGDLWFKYFNEAVAAGAITKEDIDKTLLRSYARRDLLKGNWTPQGRVLRYARPALRLAKVAPAIVAGKLRRRSPVGQRTGATS
jgi:hypothetical protein